MTGKTFNWAGHKSFALVLVALSVALAAIASAWFIELVLAVRPCPLCLEQRYAYYAAVPLALLLAVAAWRGASPALLIGGLALLALIALGNAGLGVYHAGVEWGFWAGPTDCSGPVLDLGIQPEIPTHAWRPKKLPFEWPNAPSVMLKPLSSLNFACSPPPRSSVPVKPKLAGVMPVSVRQRCRLSPCSIIVRSSRGASISRW